ncbi:4Fe-4S ferredoxin iron-sulfur binding domain protein [Geobacter metallireducens RCH3]|uniref:Iron-sulfur cluster-binding flavodoxin n=2 Tax=Geobacter metallireducens TaxID=28232 RepID=Q39VI2_GEOMG|nr:iron-sulfur cluster-binding flavodoxin [Geobacter metallireducens GS-15]EHP89380.1 4Fe-4S ferredoxin iron-sulfur binding domain protein [Geobacter metallireducens RCH3]
MAINSTRLIYFSPTQTTRKVVEGIAKGVGVDDVEHLDLTPPGAAVQRQVDTRDGLVIIGAPVYAGRLPAEAAARLQRLMANGTPAVIVVVYGNRAYEDALLELWDLALEAGFKPVAAGAFIGEHSYSTVATPIAVGRPDTEDLRAARDFGRMIREKMGMMEDFGDISLLQVPGNFPYRESGLFSSISPVTQEAACTKCVRCVSACPTGAIVLQDKVATDPSICIRCCACIKGCSAGARTMTDPHVRQVAEQLSSSCRSRKEPEMFL